MKQKFKDKIPEKFHEKCGAAIKLLTIIIFIILCYVPLLGLSIVICEIGSNGSNVWLRLLLCIMLLQIFFYGLIREGIKDAYLSSVENTEWFKTTGKCVKEFKKTVIKQYKGVYGLFFCKGKLNITVISILCSISFGCIFMYIFGIYGFYC